MKKDRVNFEENCWINEPCTGHLPDFYVGDDENNVIDNNNGMQLMHQQDFRITFMLCYILCKLLEIYNVLASPSAGNSVVLMKDAINIICTKIIQYSAYDSGAKPCRNGANIYRFGDRLHFLYHVDSFEIDRDLVLQFVQ
jgi:hypothetical protein